MASARDPRGSVPERSRAILGRMSLPLWRVVPLALATLAAGAACTRNPYVIGSVCPADGGAASIRAARRRSRRHARRRPQSVGRRGARYSRGREPRAPGVAAAARRARDGDGVASRGRRAAPARDGRARARARRAVHRRHGRRRAPRGRARLCRGRRDDRRRRRGRLRARDRAARGDRRDALRQDAGAVGWSLRTTRRAPRARSRRRRSDARGEDRVRAAHERRLVPLPPLGEPRRGGPRRLRRKRGQRDDAAGARVARRDGGGARRGRRRGARVALLALFRAPDGLGASTTWAAIAARRFATLTGVYPRLAHGSAMPPRDCAAARPTSTCKRRRARPGGCSSSASTGRASRAAPTGRGRTTAAI